MMAPIAIVVNASATAGSLGASLAELLPKHEIDAKIVAPRTGSEITGLARELLTAGYKTIVAAGGDGTVSAVAAAIVDTDAALGILPIGGLNHFARDMKIPADLEGAIENLKTGTLHVVDVAEVNGRTFLNNSGLGLYPSMVKRREKRRRMGQRKWIAFFHAAMATFRRFPFLDVRVVSGGQMIERRTPFVFIGNNAYLMEGIDLGSRESLTGGQLCIGVAQYRIGRWGLVRLALRALFGRIHLERDFTVQYTKEIHIASRHRRLPVSLDGEVAALETPLHYRTRPGALRVIAPPARDGIS